MEPIPLRTLAVLLNYERLTNDPRFQNQRILKTSLADPSVIDLLSQRPDIFGETPASVKTRYFHAFKPNTSVEKQDHPSLTFEVHPDADSVVHTLSSKQREDIFYQASNHAECYPAIGLFQAFFEICPKELEVSIQHTNKEPFIVHPSRRLIAELRLSSPLSLNVVQVSSPPYTGMTGSRDLENHSLLAFPDRGGITMLDTTRLQYGPLGRGHRGENYCFETYEEFKDNMREICQEPIIIPIEKWATNISSGGKKVDERLRVCAERAWKRWENRGVESWCEFCGKGGKLFRCSGCKEKVVSYCCKQHQVAGWKVHKFTCGKKKA